MLSIVPSFFFFFNDTATTEIYTLSLHDALPILKRWPSGKAGGAPILFETGYGPSGLPHIGTFNEVARTDRKSTRLNSSHANISYAVFCLKKKNKNYTTRTDSSS